MPPLRRHRAALLLCAACLGGLGALLHRVRSVTGELTFPLDDAYIHLALAQNLARSGTWGVNPGEFASASSSPLWTALLAVTFGAGAGSPSMAVVLNALGMTAALLVGSVLLHEQRPSVRGVTLAALAVATPLPFLAGLGMEHTLHLALSWAVLAALEHTTEPPLTEPTGWAARPRWLRLAGLALLAGVATLTRYETLFLLAGLTFAFTRRGWRTVAAAWMGATVATTAFGVWSLAHGAAFLPNPVLKKAWAGRDWLAGLREAWAEGAALLALVLAVAISFGLGLAERDRRRAIVFLTAALCQLGLGRVGWLHRYEAWLVALGVLTLVPILAGQRARGWRIAPLCLLGVVAVPLAARAAAAFREFVPAARSTFDTNVAPSRWLAATLPGTPLAVHDLGAMAFYAQAPLVDLAGLGTDDLARLHREGRLTPETLGPLLAGRKVEVAIAGPSWMDDARPASFLPVARIVVPYPAFPGTFETVVWAAEPERARSLRSALATVSWAPRVNVVLSTDLPVALSGAVLAGPAVALEPQGLSMYSNGSATVSLPSAGELRVAIAGTEGEGRFPVVRLELPGRAQEVEAPEAGVVVNLGAVLAGEAFTVRFSDDGEDWRGGDRNLTIRSVTVRP